MEINEILETRHETYLSWEDPHPACGPEGNELYAHVEHRATVHDCINMARAVAKANGHPTMGNDDRFLEDFMAVHWAKVIPANVPHELRENGE